MSDYYGEEGCCLTCEDEIKEIHTLGTGEGCLCLECKCRQCAYYEITDSDSGVCVIARRKREDWRDVGFLVDKVLRKTPKAYLLSLGGLELWFPRAVIRLQSGKHGMEVVMPRWLAEKKGLPSDD